MTGPRVVAILMLLSLGAAAQEPLRETPAGAEHTCAIEFGGAVKCWGDNWSGQLGDGTRENRNRPVDVVGLAQGASAIALGARHTCALVAGTVRCWGENIAGQLGDGSEEGNRSTPVEVSGLPVPVVAIAAGSSHSCALLRGGGVKCWGANHSGQLGDGGNDIRNVPVDVVGLATGTTAIAAGGEHTCALAAGRVKCWGANHSGQVGDGTNDKRDTAVDVLGVGARATALAAGTEHTCAVAAGAVHCWGANFSGQLGNGTRVNSNVAVAVPFTVRVSSVAAGGSHSCAVSTQGAVACWGENFAGQLGDGTDVRRTRPVPVRGLFRGAVAVAAGGEHTCALNGNGMLLCWGTNAVGQLGNGTYEKRSSPVAVHGLPVGRPNVYWRWLGSSDMTSVVGHAEARSSSPSASRIPR